MFIRLLALFILVPWLELVLLLQLGRRIGLAGTIGVILLTGVIGAALARREGLATLRTIRESLARGEVPAQGIVDGCLILAAGLVLLTPGLVTDTAGFLLLIAPARAAIRRALIRRFRSRMNVVVTGTGFQATTKRRAADAGEVIDVDAVVVDETDGS